MNQDSPQDLFIFNFPKDFVPQEIEDRYKIHLKNYHKPYATILDYLNSTILNINLPGVNFPTVMQNKHQGKEIYFKGSASPYDVYLREFTVILKSVDFNVSYMIIQDILLFHYINKTPYLDDFYVTIVDEERREQYKIIISNIIPISQSDLPLAYNIKNTESHTFTLGFKFNFYDVEYLPKEVSGSVLGEKIEDYSDIIIGNSDDTFIIGQSNSVALPVSSINNQSVPNVYDNGLSAYDIALKYGFIGTEYEWVDSLQGEDGYNGLNGTDGKSAYQIAIDYGFVGTEQEWLNSIADDVYSMIIGNYNNTSGGTITLSLNDYKREYINLDSGTSDLVMNFSSYPTLNDEKLAIINNIRGTNAKIVFPTANIISGGITFIFHKTSNDITINNGFSAEINFIYHFITSTTCEIRIAAMNFNYKSS